MPDLCVLEMGITCPDTEQKSVVNSLNWLMGERTGTTCFLYHSGSPK